MAKRSDVVPFCDDAIVSPREGEAMRHKTIPYPTTQQELTLGSSDRPPAIGTYTPRAEYSVSHIGASALTRRRRLARMAIRTRKVSA